MRYMFWNIRGCGHGGRRTQLKEYMAKERIDVVALQETIKTDFSFRELLAYDPLQRFDWHWVPSVGHSGGILMGCNRDVCDVMNWEVGVFFLAATIKHRASGLSWVIVCVYGPADHSRSAEFLLELTNLVEAKRAVNMPLIVGGDFNLIRSGADKNNANIDWTRVSLFNNAIAAAALREAARTGARFTWTNKQMQPVRSVLDRVFFTPEWEVLFPLCTLVAETRIGSDHVPLIFSSGEDYIRRSPRFYFETAWFESEGFAQLVFDRWLLIRAQLGPQRGPAECWTTAAGKLRAFLRGWGANHGSESKRERARIVDEIATLDAQADRRPFSEGEWAHRYALENQVLAILRAEEEYWRRRGGVKWVTKGDANTGYFHAYANGRKRKCSILRLQSDNGLLLTQEDIVAHIYEFFVGLLGTAEDKTLCLREDLWDPTERVSQEENEGLVMSFLPEEIDMALADMKTDTAPGPDGWPVEFFKKFWPCLK